MRPYSNKALRIAALVVRMLLGAFFICSAVAKLIDIDRFEVHVFSYNILSLNLSFLVARLVIVCELLVGIGLLANVFHRLVNICSLLMLVGFTMFLGYAALMGRTDSCQCMGPLLEINPTQSMLKNALLILLMLFAMGCAPWKWRPRWFVWFPVVVATLVTIFCISAPDNWLFPASDEVYDAEEFAEAIQPEGELYPLRLDQGRHVVAFDSCSFLYLVPTSDSTVAPLTIDSATFLRPAHLLPVMTYALITYGQRPLVFLVSDGKVEGTCHYRNIDEKRIVDFLTH